MLRDFCEPDEYAAWKVAITHTHQRRVWARVLDLNHKVIAVIENILDGQVTIDVSNREVSRLANVRLLDPSRSLGWEPDTPASLPLHQRRMIQIFDERIVPGVGPISCPVFCGPLVEVDRVGAEVTVVAEGKERRALGSFGRTHSWKRKRRKTDVIREILVLAGEAPSRIHLPSKPHARLAKPLNVSRTDKPWVEARRLAATMNMVLFYDGRGHVRMRPQPRKTTLDLDKNWLLGPVRIDRKRLQFFNGWVVLGKKPKGNKPRISSGLIGLPKSHPFAATNPGMMRNGKPYWLIREESRPNVDTVRKARQIARRMRDDRVRSRGEVSLDCLPLPNVEEYDLYRAIDPIAGRFQIRVRQNTFPLLAGPQTIGSITRVSRGGRRR